MSSEEAIKIILSEKENFDLGRDIIKKEGLNVDLWEGEGIECTSQLGSSFSPSVGLKTQSICTGLGFSKLSLRRKGSRLENIRLKLGWKLEKRWELRAMEASRSSKTPSKQRKSVSPFILLPLFSQLIPPFTLNQLTRCHNALAAILKPAGSVHPHKLATELIRLALESSHSDFKYYSWTPVQKFEEREEGGWEVNCLEKGTIRAKQIVLCSNAHTNQLFEDGSDMDAQ